MVEVAGLLLFNQIFEDADVVSLRNSDSEHPIWVITEKKAVEGEKLRGTKSPGCLDHF